METEQFFEVPENWEGERIDRLLSFLQPDESRSHFQRLIKNNSILIDSKVAKSSTIVKAGDQIMIKSTILGDFPEAQNLPLDIIYEDDQIIVLNKPINQVVHPNSLEATGTLVQSLIYHSKNIIEAVLDVDSLISRLRPGIVHRLDKDTSGVMVVAKTKAALENLSHQFQNKIVKKKYLTLVYGRVTEPCTIKTNIKRRKVKDKNIMGVSPDERGREAITHFKPLKTYLTDHDNQELSLLECTIDTGRTHQIRVHCKYFNHPVMGDKLYTNKEAKNLSYEMGINRQLLHAFELSFNHPETEKRLIFQAPMPDDMNDLINSLEVLTS